MPLDPIAAPNLPSLPQQSSERLARLAQQAQAGEPGADAQLTEACRMIEGHFVSWLLREMRQTIDHGGLLPRGPSEETYEQLFDDALAKSIARGGGLGVARTIEAQLVRQAQAQTNADAAPPPPAADENAETP